MNKKQRNANRPMERFFLCLISVVVAANLAHASGPALTTVTDTVYRANGNAAAGTVVISWPNFSTADNAAVTAGELNMPIGPGGALTVLLAPNTGATPAGTYYKVVYKLTDGTTSTEYWIVPATSPTTIAPIRATIVPTQVAAQLASRQYVDNALATNTAIVHKAGTEEISGAKNFDIGPNVPTPSISTAAANKSYVDSAISSMTTGFVHTTGDSMTGPLLLPGDPTSANHAADKHYVDVQASTLNTGLLSKLGRINDSPISLAGVRYADQFPGSSVGAQIDAACIDLAGANGTVMVPSTMGPGWSVIGVPSNCNVIDWRGNGGSSQTAYARGRYLYGRYTTVGAGLQIVSPMTIEFDAYSGGVNDITTTKTQWQGLRVTGTGRTIGERKGIEATVLTPGKGDSIGIMGLSYDLGGYQTAGDEGSEGGRFSSTQGDSSADGGFPRGTVASISGNILTGTWTTGAQNLGEQRPIINTSRGVYNTGSIVSVSGSPCTVVGSGTGWSALTTGAHSDLFLEITGNSSGATKHVVPVTSITNDTHLVIEYNLAELGATCFGASMTSSGAYNLYKGGITTSLGPLAMGNGSAAQAPTVVNLAAGGTNFQVGDSIQQPLGYNYHGRGLQVAVQRIIGEQQGGGVDVANTGTPAYQNAYSSSGNFANGINFGLGAGTLSGNGINFAGPVNGSLIYQQDNTSSSQRVLDVLNSGFTQRTLTYDRVNDWWSLSGGQFWSASDQRMGIGTNPQPNTLGYFYYNNPAWSGLIVAASVAPNPGTPLFDTEVAGVPRLRVENSKVMVNNGSDLVGYSDNQTTQKWKITGADGTISGGTINTASGYQVNGAALNFSNLAGAATKTQTPTSSVYTDQSNTFTSGTQDFSGAAHTLPTIKGFAASKPATCTQGEEYFATDAAAGQNLYFCTTTNTWTQQVGGTSYTAGNGIDISGSVISAKSNCVQTSVQAGDTLTTNGNFATTCTIAGGTLAVGSVIEVWSSGQITSGASGADYFRPGVKFGTTTVLPAAGGYISNGQSLGWTLVSRIVCISVGTSGSVEAQGFTQIGNSTGNASLGGDATQSSPVTVDTTANQTLAIFLNDNITSAGNSMSMRQLIVKISK